jgi:hypothetical protein
MTRGAFSKCLDLDMSGGVSSGSGGGGVDWSLERARTILLYLKNMYYENLVKDASENV